MPVNKLDILAFAAHPDDVEISAAGILLKHKAMGHSMGIVDLTQGELGSRGNVATRQAESQKASDLLGLTARENLNLKDGFLTESEEALMQIIQCIRKYQPDTLLINAETDRHPDHGIAHKMVKRAAFLSGLAKIKTFEQGQEQSAHRPKQIFAYIQDIYHEPDLIIDVSDFWEKRMEVLMCYASQFYNPNSSEPLTPIATPEFLKAIEGRGAQLARFINVQYAEGLKTVRPIGINDLMSLQ